MNDSTCHDVGPTLDSRAVLNIDDNPTNRALIERVILSLRPHLSLLEASTGKQGLELARRHRPALIVLDFRLPDLLGDQVFVELRSDPATRAIPVVFLTAQAQPEEVRRLRELGAVECLTKPVNLTELLALLERARAGLIGRCGPPTVADVPTAAHRRGGSSSRA